MNKRAWCGVLVGTLVMVSVPVQARVSSQSYERWIRPRSLSTREREVLRWVRSWSEERGPPVRHDGRLSRAAKALLSDVPRTPGERFELKPARQLAQRWGWTDGQLAAIALRVRTREELPAVLRQQLNDEIGNLDMNRIGLAVSKETSEMTLLLLFSRHVINLVPLASRARPGGTIRVAGTLAAEVPGANRTQLQLVASLPNGGTRRWPAPLGDERFQVDVPVGGRVGVWRLEVLADRGKGPEIAAVFPVGIGISPFAGEARPDPVEERDGVVTTRDAEVMLGSLILGARRAHRGALLAQSAQLAEAARGHGQDMLRNGFFAHVSPTTGDVTDRLRRRGIRYVRALENIAVADSVEGVFQQWMDSPAHRANILDNRVTTMGIGVAARYGGAHGPKYYAVLVLSRPPDDGDELELEKRARSELNGERARLGLSALRRDRTLDRLAARHSREMADLGRVVDTSPVYGHLVDLVFSEVSVATAAADVFLADSVGVVTQSRHVRGRFSRVGLGVHRERRRSGPQLWVTVIYAGH